MWKTKLWKSFDEISLPQALWKSFGKYTLPCGKKILVPLREIPVFHISFYYPYYHYLNLR